MFPNLHECHYPGSAKYGIPACTNRVTLNKIFCRECFQSVTPEARKFWKQAFPYDLPYDLAVKPTHEDQRSAILRFVICITFAKRQLSLFAGRGKVDG